MASNVTFDTGDFKKHLGELVTKMGQVANKGLYETGMEILRLSSREVPLDKGLLINSSDIEEVSQDEMLVGYNKVYAARLHEHPEYKFKNGRKGKYLEDPIKNNLGALGLKFADIIAKLI